MPTRLIIDIATNRITYFTKDMNQLFSLNEHVTIRDWLEELPSDMTLNNCWNWNLIGDKMTNTEYRAPVPVVSLLEQNKTKVKQLLVQRINGTRTPYFSKAAGGDWIRDRKLKEAQEGNGPLIQQIAETQGKEVSEVCADIIAAYRTFNNVMIKTEESKLKYERLLNDAVEEAQVWVLRDEIANKNLAE
jgi:hypothetical protein